jgi:hypothetical protein
MSDLETRLAEALGDGAEGAPAAVGLAAAARSRARSRRRARVAGVAALVALCIGVPTAVVAVRGSDDSRPGPAHSANDGAPDHGVPAGMRVESWRGVTALVPDSWGYGSLEDWCADGGQLEPRVERPGGVSLDIKCATSTYGLSFQELPPGQDRDQVFDWPVTLQRSKGWPPDAYVGAHGIGDVLVQVVAPTAEQAQAILGTVHPIEGADLNGCPVDTQTTLVLHVGSMSVCRYDDLARLEQSELLTGSDVDAAEAALDAAPDGFETYCPRRRFQGEIRMVSADVTAGVDLGCGDLSVTPGAVKKLTPEVLYWALSPGWSGSVPDGASLPSELRSP